MKLKRLLFSLSLLLSGSALAGESSLGFTWQPLNMMGEQAIMVCEVPCHIWYAGDHDRFVRLITAKNVPPTDNPEKAKDDINLASAHGLKLECTDLDKLDVTLDATQAVFAPEEHPSTQWRERIVRATLECVRRVAGKKPVVLDLKAKDADKAWLEPIVAEFNRHDKTTSFPERPPAK